MAGAVGALDSPGVVSHSKQILNMRSVVLSILSIPVIFVMRAYANESPIPAQPSRLQSICGRAKAADKSPGSSSAKPQRESQGRRFNRGNDEDPRALTAQIKATSTIVELLSTHRAHESRLDHIHLSACWTSLARLARQRLAERCSESQSHPTASAAIHG